AAGHRRAAVPVPRADGGQANAALLRLRPLPGRLSGAHGEPRRGAERPRARDTGQDRGRLHQRGPGTGHAGTAPCVAERVRQALHRPARQPRRGERDPRRAPARPGHSRGAGREGQLRGRAPGPDPRLHPGRAAPRAVPLRHTADRLGTGPAPAAPVHRDPDAPPRGQRGWGELKVQWWCAALGEAWEWTWRPYPGVWAFVALCILAYVLLLRSTPATAGEPRDRGTRAAAFGAGVASLWLVLDWPIGALGAGYLA